MRVERLVLGDLGTNCWIVGADVGPLLVIDPADESETVLRAVGGASVEAVVLTHGHFDHVGAATSVIEATGAPLLIHPADADAATDPMTNGGLFFGYDLSAPEADRLIEDGDDIEAGDLTLRVLHTPGHTRGSVSLYAPGHLFSGDTVFAGSVGRTDFPGGSARELRRSIEEKIAPLPDDTVIHSGHGPDSTVGRERLVNPFFPRG